MSPPDIAVQVTEIFHSIQGESTHAGRPCVFVRLTGCSLRCGYCDTRYAYFGGQSMPLDAVYREVERYGTRLVEITGGEPLEQAAAVPLMEGFISHGYTVMLETGGHVPVADVPAPVIKIIDVKCPASGEAGTFDVENLALAAPHDEFKFVIASRADYDWARDFYRRHLDSRPQAVLFSPVHGVVAPAALSEWILADGIPVRLGLQIHKYVWDADRRGI